MQSGLAYINGSHLVTPLASLSREEAEDKYQNYKIRADFSGLVVICSSSELWITAVEPLAPSPLPHRTEPSVSPKDARSPKNFRTTDL